MFMGSIIIFLEVSHITFSLNRFVTFSILTGFESGRFGFECSFNYYCCKCCYLIFGFRLSCCERFLLRVDGYIFQGVPLGKVFTFRILFVPLLIPHQSLDYLFYVSTSIKDILHKLLSIKFFIHKSPLTAGLRRSKLYRLYFYLMSHSICLISKI